MCLTLATHPNPLNYPSPDNSCGIPNNLNLEGLSRGYTVDAGSHQLVRVLTGSYSRSMLSSWTGMMVKARVVPGSDDW